MQSLRYPPGAPFGRPERRWRLTEKTYFAGTRYAAPTHPDHGISQPLAPIREQREDMAATAPLLVVEDDPKTSQLLKLFFERAGYRVVTAVNGREALEVAAVMEPLLTVLDMMLPDLDGEEVCQRLRSLSPAPILILSGRGEARHKIAGLTLGADDYVVKPCSFPELVARVKAILRRTAGPRRRDVVTYEAFTLDPGNHRLLRDGNEIALTRSEFRLLHLMMIEPGRVHTRQALLQSLYPLGGEVIERVVDVHVAKLRQKIEADPSRPRLILTVRGVGYCLAEAAADADGPQAA